MKRKVKINKSLYASQYQAALNAVDTFFNDMKKSKRWMVSFNMMLGMTTPQAMLELGRFDKLMSFIYTQIQENKR